MKAGDLVRLNENRFEHPAYKNGVLYLVEKAHAIHGGHGIGMVELITPGGTLTAFYASDLEVVSESR
jgi:hypothetical protein